MNAIEKLKNYIKKCGLTLEAEFIPQSKSRNANEKNPSVNWKLTLKKDDHSFTFDYMEGIGHFVKQQLYKALANVEKHIAEFGSSFGLDSYLRKDLTKRCGPHRYGKATPPQLIDILYSLSIDSDAINYTFQNWCSEFGYSDDSISAKNVYDQCVQTAINLKQFVDLDELREMYYEAEY